jgi:CMP/dCMP kinase
MNECFIIAVDGTAASGKGTLAEKLAAHYKFDYLDTGKIYRTAGFHALQQNIAFQNIAAILECIKGLDFSKMTALELDTEEIGRAASQLGAIPEVREALNKAQRDFAIGKNGIIVDGRDIGTIIFPNADIKLYVTATPEIRAERRFKQLQNLGKEVIYDDVLRDLRERDERDSNRKVAPLKPALDALHIDSTLLDQISVLELVITLTQGAVNERFMSKCA